MREIEFRGKALSGKWVYGGYIQSEEVICPKNASIKVFVYPKTVDQYTGLKDKNGVKIFEGDIVLLHPESTCEIYEDYEAEVVKVKWKDSYAALMLCPPHVGDDMLFCDVDRSAIEVIGNIHDNPKLLEAGE